MFLLLLARYIMQRRRQGSCCCMIHKHSCRGRSKDCSLKCHHFYVKNSEHSKSVGSIMMLATTAQHQSLKSLRSIILRGALQQHRPTTRMQVCGKICMLATASQTFPISRCHDCHGLLQAGQRTNKDRSSSRSHRREGLNWLLDVIPLPDAVLRWTVTSNLTHCAPTN